MLKKRPTRNLFKHCHCNFAFNIQCLFLHQKLSSNVHCIDNYHKPMTAHANREIKKTKTYIPDASRLTINLGFICVYVNLTTAKMLPFLKCLRVPAYVAARCREDVTHEAWCLGLPAVLVSSSAEVLAVGLRSGEDGGGGRGWKARRWQGRAKTKKKRWREKMRKCGNTGEGQTTGGERGWEFMPLKM